MTSLIHNLDTKNVFLPQYDPSFAELQPIFAALHLLTKDTLRLQYIHRMDEVDLALFEW